MAYWLLKTEPDEFSISDLGAEGTAVWDGVRNFGALNLLRDQLTIGDTALIYHSSCKRVGVAGLATVVRAGYPDPSQFDPQSPYFDSKASTIKPRWYCVDVRFKKTFAQLIPLATLKATPGLAGMTLFKQPRLSVQPVGDDAFNTVLTLADG